MSRETKRALSSIFWAVLVGALGSVGMLASCSPTAKAQDALPVIVATTPNSLGSLIEQSIYAVVVVVLAVEVLRWVVPGLKRKKGEQLEAKAKFSVLGIALAAGLLTGIGGIAPAVSDGMSGKIAAGFVAFALGLTFNETVMAALRHAMKAKQS
jgi:hypothetical protein